MGVVYGEAPPISGHDLFNHGPEETAGASCLHPSLITQDFISYHEDMMKRKGKGLLIMLAVCTMTTLAPVIHITLTAPKQVMISLKNNINIFTTRAVDPKIILFWTKFYGIERWNIDVGEEKCGPYTCTLTYDKSVYEDEVLSCFTIEAVIGWTHYPLTTLESLGRGGCSIIVNHLGGHQREMT